MVWDLYPHLAMWATNMSPSSTVINSKKHPGEAARGTPKPNKPRQIIHFVPFVPDWSFRAIWYFREARNALAYRAVRVL